MEFAKGLDSTLQNIELYKGKEQNRYTVVLPHEKSRFILHRELSQLIFKKKKLKLPPGVVQKEQDNIDYEQPRTRREI